MKHLRQTMRFMCGCPKCKRSLYKELRIERVIAKLSGDPLWVKNINRQRRLVKEQAGNTNDVSKESKPENG